MKNRVRYLPLLFIILVNATALPQQVVDLRTEWPVVRRWHDPAAQMERMLGDIPYESLKGAAEQLAPDVSVLLVTPGDDIRRREYTTYHRALYLLAPRPLWWMAPAPSDGTWEARWWISRALTAENVAAVAAEKSADCLLLVDVPAQVGYGTPVGRLPGAEIIQAGSKNCLADNPTAIVDYPAPWWPVLLLLALLAILAFGVAFLGVTARLGAQISGLETAALVWLLGAGLLSTVMLWLSGLGFSLDQQLVILTIGAAVLIAWQRLYLRQLLTAMRQWRPEKMIFSSNGERFAKSLYIMLVIVFLLFQLGFIIFMAVGRPLTIWDSWVNWGSKGRTIFLEKGITPGLYADSSREVMLLGYPLSIPLLEGWLYGWLGAADDRLVGVLFVMTYLALGGFVYGFCRRRGQTAFGALLIMGAAVSINQVVSLAATAFTDLWLLVLPAVAVVYLLEWLEKGQGGYLLLAAAAAGLLSWVKQEGIILAVVLLASFGIACFLSRYKGSWNGRRLLVGGGAMGLSALLFGGPWRIFAGREAVLVSVFMPLTVDNLLANIERVSVILALVARELVNPRTGLVWLVVSLVLLVRSSRLKGIVGHPSILLLLVPVFYLGMMSVPYIFSDFVPYRQHILSSFFRINAHILLLPLLWMGFPIAHNEGS